MRASLAIIAVAGIATFAMPRRSELRLPCVADANLSSYEGETRLNYGGSARIRLKGIQMLGVFRFDTGAARAMVVDSARIYLRYAGSDRRLRTLGFSTVSVPWTEGAGRGERINGAMCFAAAELGRRYWTAPDSDFTDAAFIPGSALVSYSDIRDEGGGWISAAVAPEIVQACIAGVSEGIAVTDEKGQTMANNDVYSREQSGSEPYLVTTGRAGPNAAPPQVTELRAIAAAPSEADSPAVRLSLKVPVGCVGVEAFLRSAGDAQAKPIPRHLLGASRAGRTMALVEGLPSGRPVVVTVRTIGPTGLRSAPASSPPTTPSAAPARVSPIEAPVSHTSLRPCPPRASGSALVVCHRPDVRCDPVSGAPDRVQDDTLWDGSSVSLTACRGETAAVSVTVTGRESPPKSVTIASSGIPARTFALRCVDAAGPLNDICIPVTGGSHTPESGGIEGRRSVQYLIEHDVPHDARPGLRTGELRVACDGAPPARFAVKMRIVEAAIPSRLTFDLSLNTYGSPARADGLDPASPEGIRSELGFHRLAA
ncbi:MAG: hypothetical protein FJX72_13485, partial [Armatimonadetes bacterium]|nr:hypothetical protein [Armatimonadota bacterium]